MTITWAVPPDAEAGTYRVRYFGDTAAGPFTGTTAPFDVGRST
ncbi:neutral/alkaline non-lysosomal ceramidase C-terminal domain-containing protein [Streptomyces spiramyceticus]|nr:neutral/alkaline non-lysosomal ceramidase C-terminal domain-containing protein [Streptomyces spiramyceticus]